MQAMFCVRILSQLNFNAWYVVFQKFPASLLEFDMMSIADQALFQSYASSHAIHVNGRATDKMLVDSTA